MYEIELKAHVDDRKAAIKNLEKFAVFSEAVEKDDTYYSASLDGKKIKVRIRKETPFTTKEIPGAPQITKQKSVIFTYKRKELIDQDGKPFEVNDEKEIFLSNAEPFEAFLLDVGFQQTLKKHKIVLGWHYNGAHLELCSVDRLGDFIEIEIMSESNEEKHVAEAKEKLLKLLAKCGVSEDKIEKRYYSQMLSDLKNRS